MRATCACLLINLGVLGVLASWRPGGPTVQPKQLLILMAPLAALTGAHPPVQRYRQYIKNRVTAPACNLDILHSYVVVQRVCAGISFRFSGRLWSTKRYGDEVKEAPEVKETLIKRSAGGKEDHRDRTVKRLQRYY